VVENAMSGILVESPHTLRIPPSATAKKALVEYAKQHGLRNEYLKKSMAGESRVLISTTRTHTNGSRSITFAG
jgi:hypothetical protein